jgi:hypothetical protein
MKRQSFCFYVLHTVTSVIFYTLPKKSSTHFDNPKFCKLNFLTYPLYSEPINTSSVNWLAINKSPNTLISILKLLYNVILEFLYRFFLYLVHWEVSFPIFGFRSLAVLIISLSSGFEEVQY